MAERQPTVSSKVFSQLIPELPTEPAKPVEETGGKPQLRVEPGGKGKTRKRTNKSTSKAAAPQSVPRTKEKVKSIRVGFYLPVDLDAEVEAIAHGLPEFVNKSHFAEAALRALVEQMRKNHNEGKPFPPLPPEIKARLKGGRPAGS